MWNFSCHFLCFTTCRLSIIIFKKCMVCKNIQGHQKETRDRELILLIISKSFCCRSRILGSAWNSIITTNYLIFFQILCEISLAFFFKLGKKIFLCFSIETPSYSWHTRTDSLVIGRSFGFYEKILYFGASET